MARKYPSNITVSPYNVGTAQPLDVRTVVENISDLLPASLLKTTYIGMIVYVLEDSSLYVCYNKPARATQSLTNVEDGWRKVDADYSVRIVESETNLTDGTILFPYQGMIVYVTSESSLYLLLTKGLDNSKDINNWKKISNSASSPAIDKIGINKAPDGGSGFKIIENKDVIVEDYVNVENYIKANYFYTSKGVNSFDFNPNFTYDSVKLTKGTDSYIELFSKGDNWIAIYDPNNTFGFSIKSRIDGKEENVSLDENGFVKVQKETPICFGVDIKFTDGWTISYGDFEPRAFVESDYELIDVYRSVYSPGVYAYIHGMDVKVLTEDDIVTLANSIPIDLENGDSDFGNSDNDGISEPQSLQNVIVNMNNAIAKLEQTVVEIEPDRITESEIDSLFF